MDLAIGCRPDSGTRYTASCAVNEQRRLSPVQKSPTLTFNGQQTNPYTNARRAFCLPFWATTCSAISCILNAAALSPFRHVTCVRVSGGWAVQPRRRSGAGGDEDELVSFGGLVDWRGLGFGVDGGVRERTGVKSSRLGTLPKSGQRSRSKGYWPDRGKIK